MVGISMANYDRASRWATKLAWVHALLFGAIALGCYLSPETAFGDSAWLPLARLAVRLFAAVLTALVIVLVGSARSGNVQHVKLALLAALALDVQVPIFVVSLPASVEYLDSKVGIPWFAVPLTFLILVGTTVHCFLWLRRSGAFSAIDKTRQQAPASIST
jgi:hypothetical protein